MQPQSPANELKVICSLSVEHTGTRTLELPSSPQAMNFPFDYDAEERLVLAHYLSPYYDAIPGAI